MGCGWAKKCASPPIFISSFFLLLCLKKAYRKEEHFFVRIDVEVIDGRPTPRVPEAPTVELTLTRTDMQCIHLSEKERG